MAEHARSDAREGGLSRADARRMWGRSVDVLTRVVRIAGSVCAALLAIHVVFTLGGANPDNGITEFVASAADTLALGFQDLFMPADPQLEVLVNYGTAALFWLVITGIATRILTSLR
ncbi:hypothetical protein [Saccharopolyspora halophila]|uniref:hypothetical protein n=1 Tax=Saccharopolyspora halophila TaxID=405551 RepID=UPI0031D0FBA9